MDFISSRVKQNLQGFNLNAFSFFDGYPDLNRAEIVSTYPEKWVNTYSEQKLFLIDPVIKYSRNNVKPFFGRKVFFLMKGRSLNYQIIFQYLTELVLFYISIMGIYAS